MNSININKNNTNKLIDISIMKVPYITINGQQNTNAQTGLQNVICNSYNVRFNFVHFLFIKRL